MKIKRKRGYFMRKKIRKLTAVGLTMTSLMSLAACGGNGTGAQLNHQMNRMLPSLIQ